jgi:argininosuccinate lyase
MPRFRDPPDPVFWRLNASLRFDRRLAAYDVRQSRAHATALRGAGVISDEELREIEQGLDAVARELDDGSFPFQDSDEDIHMAIERRLTELAGPVGGKLHTARSRNDQVATDMALYVRERSERAVELLRALMERLIELAERHADWPMPGYTHLQRAQPVYLGHHLMAHFWMFRRDASRFALARAEASVLPLGAGALAGVGWEIDREAVARELGFESVAPNSIDAVSNRDFVLDHLAAAATCAVHLSRLGGEIVLWSSGEFAFCEPAENFSSGSSIMPQKKNPDAAELLRAKGPRIAAAFTTLTGVLHGLPLGYSKDMQEDKEALFDAADNLELCLQAADGLLRGIAFDRERLAEAARDEMALATEVADMLVRRGMPFREAHGVVGDLVRDALDRGKSLSELTPEEIAARSELLDEEYYEVLRPERALEAKRSAGGTGSEALAAQLRRARDALAEIQR